MSLLAVEGLATGYKRIPILRRITFQIEEGEFLGILGHNGMGKSTLLKALSGELTVTAGTIGFAGQDVTSLPSHQRSRLGIGYVPQGRQIFASLSVQENLRIAALGAGRDVAIVDEVLEDFPRLHTILDRAGGVLSGGEQQILALARALCGRPQLILLDEPTEGIQPTIRREIVALLKKLRAKHQLTVLLVEQNVEFIESLSDRILVMEKGRLGAVSESPSPTTIDLKVSTNVSHTGKRPA